MMNDKDHSFVKGKFREYKDIFEKYLTNSIENRKAGVPDMLFESMEYSLNAGGKRLRPVLCLSAAEANGCKTEDVLPMALGLEMLHTATLIHDDLPCMDNDDLRRGKPTNHKVYGETMAVLAGDALLAQSIEYPLYATKNVDTEKLMNAIKYFVSAIGPSGVCGGQVLDMFVKTNDKASYVKEVAKLKTGALIKAAVLSGAALGTSDISVLNKYSDYSTHLGSAFQIVDDILDVISTAEELGKTPGKDAEQDKCTHVTVFGLDKAKEMALNESLLAQKEIEGLLSESSFLYMLPEYLVSRTK